jgi:long-chain acyl-CoA synthetase
VALVSARATNLVQFLQRSVERWPDRPLLGSRRPPGPHYEWLGYRDFGRRVDALRAGLAQLQVERGTIVGIISNNRLEWAVAHFATLGRGACWVPMYEVELPAMWEHILRDAEVEVLFVANAAVLEKVKGLASRLPKLRDCIVLEGTGEGTLDGLEALG